MLDSWFLIFSYVTTKFIKIQIKISAISNIVGTLKEVASSYHFLEIR